MALGKTGGRNGCEGSRTPWQRQNLAKQPAHSGLFGDNREISVRTRMRGGPGKEVPISSAFTLSPITVAF